MCPIRVPRRDESFFVHVHSLLCKAKPLRDFLCLGAVLNRMLFSESQLVGFDGQLRGQQQTTLGGIDLDGPVDAMPAGFRNIIYIWGLLRSGFLMMKHCYSSVGSSISSVNDSIKS